MLAKEELLLIVYFIVVILLLTSFGIVFFVTFQKRKNKLLRDQYEAEKRFEKELTQSKLEIQEQTLKNVGWELHDNIGQLLSVANMQLNMLSRTVESSLQPTVTEIKGVVANSLQEVRSLSRSLNNEIVNYAGLEASVKNELLRFERLNMLSTNFEIKGETFEVPAKDAIILFRIQQEFFSNVIKHSKATTLELLFKYNDPFLEIEMKDNGVGFDAKTVKKSSGLITMESRAALINTNFVLKSSITKGTSLTLSYRKTA